MIQEQRIQDIAARYAAMPGVVAVALGGSHGAGKADAHSDIDLYIYHRGQVPVSERRALAEERGKVTNVDTGYWGPEDGWLERTDNLHVEAVFRDVHDMQEYVTSRLERHEPGVGYSTAFLFTFQHSQALFDPTGWLQGMQEKVAQPYPDGLARAIMAHNLPLLRGLISSYPHQLETAVRRGDIVSVNHRLTEFLSSYFDILFALNRTYHPGEKRLLAYAESLTIKPAQFSGKMTRLLSFTAEKLNEMPAQVEQLTNDLTQLVKEHL